MDKRYQVFVSSTYEDLKDERRAIIQTLLQMDCIPAGMELFPAANDEQFQFITKIIDDRDYYILIIGGRYGSTTSEGLSYTEKEFDYARSIGLRTLSFIHGKPEEIPYGKPEVNPDLRIRLEAFRKKVASDAMVKFWADPQELNVAVMTSLVWARKVHPAVGWVRANRVANVEVLSQLAELRDRNDSLEQRLSEMSAAPQIENLAGIDDAVNLTGRFKQRGYADEVSSVEVTWGRIFAAIGPDVISVPNDAVMSSSFRAAMQGLYQEKKKITSSGHWYVDDQWFGTVKVQFIALGLVTVTMQNTRDGGMAPFWALTALGEQTLMQLRAVKRAAPENS